MITFIVTAAHQYTVKVLCEAGAGFRVMSYDALFCARELRPGAYIFCDHERLSHLELLAAAEIFQVASQSPRVRCFNDPARVRTRFGLLRALREAGINDFDVYAGDGLPRPRRFPVFIREIATHGKPLSPLLADQAALEGALEGAVAAGYPLSGVLVIEFCAEPFREDVWRRWSAYAVGARVAPGDVVSEDNWNVKYGSTGLVDDAVYAADDLALRGNAHAEVLAEAFRLAGIAYGRADYGLVGGRPQIYEINTNPFLSPLKPHESAIRQGSLLYSRACLLEGLAAMDAPEAGENVGIELTQRQDAKHAIDELRAQLRAPRHQIARLEDEIFHLKIAERAAEPPGVAARGLRRWLRRRFAD